MFLNMKVSTRLFSLIGLFMASMAVLIVISLTQLNNVVNQYTVVTGNIVPAMSLISQIRGGLNRVVIYEKRHILNAESGHLVEIENVLTQKKAEVKQLFSSYEKYVLPEEQEIFKAVTSDWDEYLVVHEQVIAFSRDQRIDEARALSGGESNSRFNDLAESFGRWADLNVEFSDRAAQDAEKIAGQAQMWMIIISIFSTLLTLGGGLFIASTISGPINKLRGVAERIAAGDLEQRAEVTGSELGALAMTFNRMADNLRLRLLAEQEQRQHLQHTVEQYVDYMADISRGNLSRRITVQSNGGGQNDPLVILGNNLNQMTGNLQHMIGQVREAASNLNSAAAEILAATTQQASGASEQSAAISQTTTTVEEVKSIAEQSSLRAHEVTNTAQRTVEVSRAGQQAVRETIESMVSIKDRVEGIAENILALSEQTQQIGEIIATVNEIASQSNMLALNASVEAARAGEQGKGFAVVASEVRSLAEQSRQATTQVKAILSEIQKATNATVMATEEGTKGVDHGVNLASQAQKSIDQLSTVITDAAQAAMQMAAGGQQQVAGVDQVAMAMQNINQATIQSLASTRQAERAAQNLNELARHLTEIVDQYQV